MGFQDGLGTFRNPESQKLEENHQIVVCAFRRTARFCGRFRVFAANPLFKRGAFPYPTSKNPAKRNNTTADDPFFYLVVDILVIFLHFSLTLCRIIPDIDSAEEPSARTGADIARRATTVSLPVRAASGGRRIRVLRTTCEKESSRASVVPRGDIGSSPERFERRLRAAPVRIASEGAALSCVSPTSLLF